MLPSICFIDVEPRAKGEFLSHSEVHKAGPWGARLSTPTPGYQPALLVSDDIKAVLISDCVNSGTGGKGHHAQ